MNENERRLKKLEDAYQPTRKTWETAVVIYNASDPGDLARKQMQTLAEARAAGWTPDSTTPLAFFIPDNGRPHPGRDDT